MVVMLRPERLHRLFDQPFVRRNLLRGRGQLRGRVADDVERHLGAELDPAIVRPGDQGGIDEDFIARHRIVDLAAGLPARPERRGDFPARRHDHRCLDRNLRDVIAGRIHRQRQPLDARHVGGHHRPALVGRSRRQELEFDVDRGNALRHIDVESVDLDRIALPLERLPVGADLEARDLADFVARAVTAGDPFGIEQDEVAGPGHRHALADSENAARDVGRIDRQLNGARKGNIARRRYRILLCIGFRLAVEWRHELRRGGTRQAGGKNKASANLRIGGTP